MNKTTVTEFQTRKTGTKISLSGRLNAKIKSIS